MANSGEAQRQWLQRLCQSSQRNEAWSGRRDLNPGSQLGKLSIVFNNVSNGTDQDTDL